MTDWRAGALGERAMARQSQTTNDWDLDSALCEQWTHEDDITVNHG